ncbi:LacI family DNA-binding transcriptional regulator [Demequina sp. TTPB684]|uniref:LacI family DNA-binding transcriptional regulator n=1 Tax=unclassified Demequina TaxID=2620311 RepID=UPI001CF22B51|nr:MULTISPECIES: LacI family DNA-binding transcriptional regulator [unclassified Demequina]MCB2412961.1 LacI family DNA-binding transcriptional regulator [Demequina sp. TTPB684]UPU88351.1 LacI family DNA-binding transcriptional regulator [Demequina sp. TMPB413]
MSAKRRPTMADVAARAGVSLSTVSLTYSGAGPISPDMRSRVEKAAADLGYAGPSPRAQALRSGRSRVVGLVIHERLHFALRDPFTLRVLDALIGDLGEMGQGVLLLSSPSENPTEPNLLATAAMDAAVLMRVRDHDEPALDILARRELPFAIVEGTAPGAAAITIPDRRATADLIRHLVALGHERIATVTLPREGRRDTGIYEGELLAGALWTPTRNRLAAFGEAGVEPCVVIESSASMVEAGVAAGHLAFSHPSKPTAVVCQSDLLAGGVVLAARERGLRVPEDVSITGFDGLDLPWLQPLDLTTVPQDGAAKGHLIAQGVRALLSGDEPPVIELPLEIRIGNSTAQATP